MNLKIIEPALNLEHPSVRNVLDIAQDILDQNKTLNINTLYNIAKKELKIPRKGLLKIIQFLINKNILIDGSKYTKKSILTNFYRRSIYNFIENNLGAHFSLLRKEIISDNEDEMGSSGQLIWHLEMLLKFDYIKKIKVGNYSIFITIDLDEETGKISFLLKDEINRKIISLLVKNKKMKQSNIHKKIEEKRSKVYYHINNLVKSELILSEELNSIYIYLNPKKQKKIRRVLKYIKENFKDTNIYLKNNKKG
jgi:predicted transcriptional regulator